MESDEEMEKVNKYTNDKIYHLIEHLDNPAIKIHLLSKEEFFVAQIKNLELYKINKDKINKQYSIKVDSIIKSIIVKNNILVVTTNKGLIFFQKNSKNEFTEIKRLNSRKKNEIYYYLLDLRDNNNLICAFSLSFFSIINISNYQFESHFTFQTNLKGKEKIFDDEINVLLKNENEQNESVINLESFDTRSNPFLIKSNNKYLMCFKLLGYCIVLNYKTMKIIKKIDYSEYFSFNLYKSDDEYSFFILY